MPAASRAWRRSRWKCCARGRRVRDPDVLLRGELEEALEASARVLGAVALVAVRQQKRQACRLTPLREARDDELVDHDLRAVDEVAELRLPQNERLRCRDRVAVLESEARIFRERRVVDLEGRRGVIEVLQRREDSRRCARRAGRRAGARTCRARCPGRSAGSGCPRRATNRMRAPPPGPSRSRLLSIVLSRRSSWLRSFGCTVKCSGTRRSSSFSSRRRSAETAVTTPSPARSTESSPPAEALRRTSP